MRGGLRVKLLFLTIGVAAIALLISRLLVVNGIISWKLTGLSALLSVGASQLITLYILQGNRSRIKMWRYSLLFFLVLLSSFYLYYKQSLVCFQVERIPRADGTLFNHQVATIIGTKLRDSVATPEAISMNATGEKCGLFAYNATHNSDDIWSDVQGATNKLLGTYLLMVVLLASFLTHLAEEIWINKKLAAYSESRKVFISYSHQNAAIAQRLKAALAREKIQLVMDENNMLFGDKIETFIEEAIRTCRITLSVVSKESLLSTWVGMETILTFYAEKFDNTKTFIACYLDDAFLQPDFTNKALAAINEKQTALQAEMSSRHENDKTTDLDAQRERLVQLRQNIGTIVHRLQTSLLVDCREPVFEVNVSKLILQIKDKLKD